MKLYIDVIALYSTKDASNISITIC
jgi:hypothetical protein